jgi:hypothetical protein
VLPLSKLESLSRDDRWHGPLRAGPTERQAARRGSVDRLSLDGSAKLGVEAGGGGELVARLHERMTDRSSLG